MPLPFKRVFQRPGVKRILWPFTVALFILLIALAALTA